MTPIVIFAGAPAVGKSSTSRALAAQFPKSIHISVDDIRHMVVSGLVLPSLDWSAELVAQFHLARQSVVQMALIYRQAGYAVMIDDIWDEQHSADYQTLMELPELAKVLLYPSQTEAHRRNEQRSGDSPARAYIDEGISAVYGQLRAVVSRLQAENWYVLDTSALSIEQSVTVLKARLQDT